MQGLDWNLEAGLLPLGALGVVALYLVTSYFSWRVSDLLRPYGSSRRSEARVWIAIALVFLVLGIFREFDVQTALTDYWRSMAREQGWYGNRRNFQPIVIMAIGAAFLVVTILLVSRLPRLSPITRVAVGGTLMLMTYVAVRTVSYHDVDVLAGQKVLGLRLSWILEFAGVGLVMLPALRRRATLVARSRRLRVPEPKDFALEPLPDRRS